MPRASVPATMVESTIACIELGEPGSYFIDETKPFFILAECPCGCHGHMRLCIVRKGEKPVAQPAWEWNGSIEKPTLSPSIRDLSNCFFHGHLVNGLWSFEGDSGQKA